MAAYTELDLTLIRQHETEKELILANINLNSLLGLMDYFTGRLRPDSMLMLSGFFSEELQRIHHAAERNGLEFAGKHVMNNWTVAVYRKAL